MVLVMANSAYSFSTLVDGFDVMDSSLSLNLKIKRQHSVFARIALCSRRHTDGLALQGFLSRIRG